MLNRHNFPRDPIGVFWLSREFEDFSRLPSKTWFGRKMRASHSTHLWKFPDSRPALRPEKSGEWFESTLVLCIGTRPSFAHGHRPCSAQTASSWTWLDRSHQCNGPICRFWRSTRGPTKFHFSMSCTHTTELKPSMVKKRQLKLSRHLVSTLCLFLTHENPYCCLSLGVRRRDTIDVSLHRGVNPEPNLRLAASNTTSRSSHFINDFRFRSKRL